MRDLSNTRDRADFRAWLHPEYGDMGGDGKLKTSVPDFGIGVGNMFELARIGQRANLLRAAPKMMGIPASSTCEARTFCVIYREHEYLDMVTMMTQIGAMPAPVAALARRLKVNFSGLRLPGFQGIDILLYGEVFLVPLWCHFVVSKLANASAYCCRQLGHVFVIELVPGVAQSMIVGELVAEAGGGGRDANIGHCLIV